MPSSTRVQANQQQQKFSHDGKHKLCEFQIDDTVYVKNFSGTPAGLPDVIEQCRGPLSFM